MCVCGPFFFVKEVRGGVFGSYLFIYFWLYWVFIVSLSVVSVNGGLSVVMLELLLALTSLVAEHRL